MSINNYIGDELANKVIHLSRALDQANNTIYMLETQHEYLKDVLISLTSPNNGDYNTIADHQCESTIGSGL